MSESGFWPKFVLAVLATWRVTHLLASEDGPADLVARGRVRLGRSFLGSLMDCFNCLSVWVAAPVSLLVCRTPADLLRVWLALSGAACLLERLGSEPVMFQQISPPVGRMQGETSDGMLWTEEGGDKKRCAADAGCDTTSHQVTNRQTTGDQ